MNFGDDAGKYCCFCCGVQFSEYMEFKDHILETHEEGREFVRCPLDHCRAPVRDIKLHLKVKHPGTKVNFTGQTRAIIWHDFSAKGKKTRKPRFKQGKYESTKTGKVLTYRSGLEERLYKIFRQT